MCLKSYISSFSENQWLCKDNCVPHGKVLFWLLFMPWTHARPTRMYREVRWDLDIWTHTLKSNCFLMISKTARGQNICNIAYWSTDGFRRLLCWTACNTIVFGMGLTCSRARGLCKIFCKGLWQLRFTCARMCAAPRREPHFEKEPPSIPVTVGNL